MYNYLLLRCKVYLKHQVIAIRNFRFVKHPLLLATKVLRVATYATELRGCLRTYCYIATLHLSVLISLIFYFSSFYMF